MSQYIVRAHLSVGGRVIGDFKSFQEDPVTYNKQIPLMYTTGTAPVTHRYKFKAEYVVPQGGGIDFTDPTQFPISGVTFNVLLDGGESFTYGDVAVETVTETKIDSENEYIRDVSFIALSKTYGSVIDTGVFQ